MDGRVWMHGCMDAWFNDAWIDILLPTHSPSLPPVQICCITAMHTYALASTRTRHTVRRCTHAHTHTHTHAVRGTRYAVRGTPTTQRGAGRGDDPTRRAWTTGAGGRSAPPASAGMAGMAGPDGCAVRDDIWPPVLDQVHMRCEMRGA